MSDHDLTVESARLHKRGITVQGSPLPEEQGSVILVLMVYYSAALSLAGLNFGLAIGLIGGLLSFIPFVGFITGFVLSMAIALVQFWPDQARVSPSTQSTTRSKAVVMISSRTEAPTQPASLDGTSSTSCTISPGRFKMSPGPDYRRRP